MRKRESSMWPGALLGAVLILGYMTPMGWWDVVCWFTPNAYWCPKPVKDPPLPAPQPQPDPPPPDEPAEP